MLLCSSSKKASRRPSFLALRKCWAAESFNPGGRAGLQMWPSTHDGTTWEVQQLNNACGAALKCMHKPYDIIYKLHVQRETGVLPSPTQAGTPDTFFTPFRQLHNLDSSLDTCRRHRTQAAKAAGFHSGPSLHFYSIPLVALPTQAEQAPDPPSPQATKDSSPIPLGVRPRDALKHHRPTYFSQTHDETCYSVATKTSPPSSRVF